jgi:hypothetical protein
MRALSMKTTMLVAAEMRLNMPIRPQTVKLIVSVQRRV